MRVRVLLVAVLVCGLFASGSAAVLVDTPLTAGEHRSSIDAAVERSNGLASPPTSTQPSLRSDPTASALACPVAAQSDGVPHDVAESRIVELYPNPTTPENAGEFFVLETPPETSLETWTVTDGHTTASFPNETVSGRAAVTIDADETAALTDDDPLELEGHLRLATDGDSLEIRNGSERIDTVSYDDAPEAERWYRSDVDGESGNSSTGVGSGQWWPRGATCLPSTDVTAEDATAFVLPDSPEIPRETIRDADEQLSLAGYTFTSDAITSELVAASERGVDVEVLIESGPVGGAPAATEPTLEALEDGGVDVRVTGGEHARYRYHHPKYAVADETVLVTSENWKPSGVGGASSRGWGITIENAALASDLGTVFDADFEGRDTESGTSYLEDGSFAEPEDQERSPSEFPSNHPPESVEIDSVELLFAPDNAEPRLRELLEGAEDEILVKQASIGGPDVSLVEETIDAARRGVDVRILLDSSWYVEADNAELKAALEQTAADENLPLEVALVEPENRFEKIHAKGVIIDGETTVVGSLNWNDNSLQNNREVVLAVHGDEAAAYYKAVFDADWEGGTWSLPIGLALGVVLALLVAALIGRRYISFGDSRRSVADKVSDSQIDYDSGSNVIDPVTPEKRPDEADPPDATRSGPRDGNRSRRGERDR
ncbi:phospholipase [Halostagnicola larsenii XH-48]|uniref:Phospholipase n=1 Tax=Halostagnicola larsenii XH-48 TaxID=797299 RepID=W0JQ08_9EURY|nr:phospholipase D-like domain-containing protein [Halostagnicola larsenii]AHF99087.1 phospholipase [Halostagnicola larsenii XH-48]